MLDSYFTSAFQRLFCGIARVCVKWNISANIVTMTGIVSSACIVILLWMQWYIASAVFIVINRFFDGVDGAIARVTKSNSVSGGFLDIIIDYVFYGSVPLGLALADIDRFAFTSVCVLFAYLLSGVLFMASSAYATTLCIAKPSTFSIKSLYYPINPIEGTETIIFSILCCIFPHYYTVLGAVMSGLLVLLFPFRAYIHFRNFSKKERENNNNLHFQ